jgi:hypothetical protein
MRRLACNVNFQYLWDSSGMNTSALQQAVIATQAAVDWGVTKVSLSETAELFKSRLAQI